jgi:hypothetical protein
MCIVCVYMCAVVLYCCHWVSTKCVLYCCHRVSTKCVLYCCHRVSTQLRLNTHTHTYIYMYIHTHTHTHSIRLTAFSLGGTHVHFTFHRPVMSFFRYRILYITFKRSLAPKINSRLKPGNACYHSVQNLLSSSLLSKNV